jgi:hypothetical protein
MPDYPVLTPEKALIFRITHRDNVPWILDHGLHCASSATRDPNFIAIGKPDLIERRTEKQVPIPPGGVLADYVPFYFAPTTPMLYNILTGRAVTKRDGREIVFLVSSLPALIEHHVDFVFTDRHAALATAQHFRDLAEVHRLPWSELRARDFHKDPDDPDRFERYQAEALAFQLVPISAISAIACYAEDVRALLDREIERRRLTVKVVVRAGWYIQ